MRHPNERSFRASRPFIRRWHLEYHMHYWSKEIGNSTPENYWQVHDVTGAEVKTGSAWSNQALGDSFGLTAPCVYVWHRLDRVRYVGMTEQCLRLRLRSHSVITRQQLRDDDRLTIYDCEPYYGTYNVERTLIDLFQPPFNRR